MKSHAAGARALGALSALACTVCLSLFVGRGWAAEIKIGDKPTDGAYGEITLGSGNYGNYTPQPDGTLIWSGEYSAANLYSLNWSLHLDPDPFVSGSLTLTNLSAVPSIFTLSVAQPVAPAVPVGAIMSGSSAITLADANFNSLANLASPAGSAIFTGTLDGVAQRTLFGAPYSLTPAFPPAGLTAVDSRSFSNEITTLPLNTQIGITHSFTLSPGDTVTMNSTFQVIVPEPASAVLAAIAGVGLVIRLRRRAASR
jgi:hypothetical protein